MTVDFSLTAQCNHIVDGLQYWGFDGMSQDQSYFLENDSSFRNKFLKKMAYRVCPRCGGKGYYNDFHFEQNENIVNSLSKPVMVQGKEKLIQDLNKFLVTIMGENIFHNLYGVGYQQYIGTKIVPDTLERMKMLTISSLDYMKSLYNQQKTYQDVDPSESFSYVKDVEVFFDPTTPISLFISATLISEAGDQADTGFAVSTVPRSNLPEGVNSDVTSFTRLG